MQKRIMLTAAVLSASMAWAYTVSAHEGHDHDHDHEHPHVEAVEAIAEPHVAAPVVDRCAVVGSEAASIMQRRFEGQSPVEQLRANVDSVHQQLVLKAYDALVIDIDSMRATQISDFKSKVELDCLTGNL